MKNINTTDVASGQYNTDSNLHSRIRVKQLFSTGKQSWADFLIENFHLKPNHRILELGCGNGIFWRARANKIPEGIKLTLSDLSSGMLDAAKSNTMELDFIENYAVIDVQSLPYEADTFDIVIANYMLYHVPDIQTAINEISRVLKRSGSFFAATFGKDNLKEVYDIFSGFDKRIDAVPDALTKVFGLENGGFLLGNSFDSVELRKFKNNLHITELEPLVEYFLSYRGLGNVGEIILDDKVEQFSDYLSGVFLKKGYVDIMQDEGLFVSSIPTQTA